MTQMWFDVLDVGQGSGNFIEFKDNENAPLKHAVLIDFGSTERRQDTEQGPWFDYVVRELKRMPQPTLEAVILSHPHADHLNLIENVLKAFEPHQAGRPANQTTLKVNKVFYGSAARNYKKGILEKLEECGAELNEFGTLESNFEPKDGEHQPFLPLGGANFYCYMANAVELQPGAKKPKINALGSPNANTASVVVVVSFESRQIIATGDATGVTLRACNKVTVPAIKANYLNKVVMVTLPHHGSKGTTLNVPGIEPDGRNANVMKFVRLIDAGSITASAGWRFGHPAAEVIWHFVDNLDPVPMWNEDKLRDRHFYTAHFAEKKFRRTRNGVVEQWPDRPGYYTVQTQANIYTNLYYDTTPGSDRNIETVLPPNPGTTEAVPAGEVFPIGISWSYQLTNQGCTLKRLVNTPGLLALRAAILAGVRPEDLPDADEIDAQYSGRQGSQPSSEPPASGVTWESAPGTRPGGGGQAGRPVRGLDVIW